MVLTFLQFIPLSLAAITPTMVVLVTALLANDGHAKRALAVVTGRCLGLLVVGFATLFVLHQVPRSPVRGALDQHEALPLIFLIAGIVLLVAAVLTLVHGDVPSEKRQSGRLERMKGSKGSTLFAVFFISTFVSVRQLSLLVAGTAIIREAEVDVAEELILLVVLCVMMVWPMLAPIGLAFGMGERGDAMLERLRDQMRVHQREINAVVLAFFGGMLTVKGIAGL